MQVAAHPLPLTPEQHIAQLESRIVALTEQLHASESSLERVRRAYTHALEQLSLLRRQMFVAKAERVDTAAEQLAFDTMFAEVKRLEKALDEAEGKAPPASSGDNEKEKKTKPNRKGRRNLADLALPVVRVEISDPALEGKAERMGIEESWRYGYERGGPRRILLERVVYKVLDAVAPAFSAQTSPLAIGNRAASEPSSPTAPSMGWHAVTAALPKELSQRSFLAPSMIAHVLVMKYVLGVPFYRLEQQMACEGAPLDRGTMCRYAEDIGATLGAIVEAARLDAFRTAFCLSTDATGVSIQLGAMAERAVPKRAPCRKGHFFVVLADKDHIFFEYQPKHTSLAVCTMFKGFSGYIQADAHAIYDALFRGTQPLGMPSEPERGPPPTEVGCWSHCRRNFWEAAVCKHELGLEGLRRIDLIFAADRLLADLPPSQRKARREVLVRPLVNAFFTWVTDQHALARERGLVATALGYAHNQEQPLRRFLEDGRLRLESNASERALRAIATGRKAWLFFGSDDHASAAANLFSLVASCKLHNLDPELYLAQVIRVMPYWPRDRYLELCPKYWARTRAALDPDEMARPLCHVTVPPAMRAEEQATPS